MSNYQLFAQFIKEISGQANIISINRIYIKLTGDIKSALFLSQCVYWSDKSSRTDGFFYKTAQEWEEETGISRHELARIREGLSDYVETKLMKANGAPTVHYKPDLVKIAQWIANYYIQIQTETNSDLHESGKSNCAEGDNPIDEKGQIDLQEIVKSLTSITTSITTPNNDKKNGARKTRTPHPPKDAPDPRSRHPAILCAKGITGRYPPKSNYDQVIEILGEHPDGAKAAECYKWWTFGGRNVAGLGWLDWYKDGIPEWAMKGPVGKAASPDRFKPSEVY